MKKDGFTFDMGPTLITAPHLLDDLWATAGRNLKEDVTLVPLSPFYHIYFHDGRYCILYRANAVPVGVLPTPQPLKPHT